MRSEAFEQWKMFLGILVVIAVGFFIYNAVTGASVGSVTNGNVEGLTVKHHFQNGMHTVVGTVDLPTPCHQLYTNVSVDRIVPQQVLITLDARASSDLCVQVITPQTFKASFEANESAIITATFDSVPVPVTFVRVSRERDLESF